MNEAVTRKPSLQRVAALSVLVAVAWTIGLPALGETASDPLAPWRSGVKVQEVAASGSRHTIHSYFNVSPESPDARFVLFYASPTADGHKGELRVIERASGEERALAADVEVEDAHRAACQQWVCDGREVAFHNVREGKWHVAAVEVATGKTRILARDRQLGWGQAGANVVPLYGCHWDPGEHRDLELLDLETGTIRVAVTAAAVAREYPDWIAKKFGDRPVSIFFPILSPDLKRVFFKMATPAGGDFRSSKASQREGLVVYDLEQSRFLLLRGKWGHPCWHPDSQTILEPGGVLIGSGDGATRRVPNLPSFRGSHPSFSPDGRLFVTDAFLETAGKAADWGVVVVNVGTGEHLLLHRFDNSRGARSWRRSHPHPVFSPDGRRIYFNASNTEWTRLYVAQSR